MMKVTTLATKNQFKENIKRSKDKEKIRSRLGQESINTVKAYGAGIFKS